MVPFFISIILTLVTIDKIIKILKNKIAEFILYRKIFLITVSFVFIPIILTKGGTRNKARRTKVLSETLIVFSDFTSLVVYENSTIMPPKKAIKMEHDSQI